MADTCPIEETGKPRIYRVIMDYMADDLEDGTTGYLIERALDEARSRYFHQIIRG
jgi:hypothetical protein